MKHKTLANRNSNGRRASESGESTALAIDRSTWTDGLSPRFRRFLDWSLLAILLLGFTIIFTTRLHDGVVPHDTGTLAHSAERVLHGQLPHRDFDDPYTGGLSLLNAAAFKLFGVNVLSTRVLLMSFALLTFGVLYFMYRRAMPIEFAVLLTITTFSWSVPHYFSPMPSWYNLFFGVFALASLLKYAETDRRAWLAAAGFFTGLSLLIKVIGIYFAAVAALFVIFLEQRRSERSDALHPTNLLCTGFITTGLALFVCGVMSIVGATAHWPGWLTFDVPALTLAGFLALNEWRLRHHHSAARLARILIGGGWFFAGLMIPVAVFLVPYALSGSLGTWFEGVFIMPLRRLDHEMARTIDMHTFSVGVIMTACGGGAVALAARSRTLMIWSSAAASAAFILLMISIHGGVKYAAFWDAVRLLPATACLGLCIRLLRRPVAKHRNGEARDENVERLAFLFAAAAGLFGLVQYPIVNGIYFLYVAPLVIAAVWFTAAVIVPHSRVPGVVWCGFVLVFTGLWVWPGSSFMFGTAYFPAQTEAVLNSSRMPLRYDATSVEVLNLVKKVVQEHSAPDAPILSFPDTPHIYFLTKRKNPTRTFFDVFDSDYGTPQRDRRLLKLLEREKVPLIVERNFTSFSTEEPTDEFRTEIRRRYPNRFVVQDAYMRYFTIRWRDDVKQTATHAAGTANNTARTTAMSASLQSGL